MDLHTFADAAQSAAKLDDLTTVTRSTLEERGFNAFIFSGGQAGGVTRSFFGVCNRPYLEQYKEMGLSVVDPVARQVNASWLPVPWDCEDYIGRRSAPWSDLFEMSANVGYSRGISTPINGPRGERRVLCAIFDGGRDELMQSWRRLGNELMVLGAHLAFACDRLTSPAGGEAPSLTVRQCECLIWSAKGKTAWEVSKIIGVSERTVNFHIQSAMGKLAASSKHHAWIKAVRLGLINA